MIDGVVSAESLTAAGQTYRSIRFVAQGTPEASRFTASAVGQGFDLDAQGRLVPGDATRIELASFTARRGGRRLSLAQPASIALQSGTVTLSNRGDRSGPGPGRRIGHDRRQARSLRRHPQPAASDRGDRGSQSRSCRHGQRQCVGGRNHGEPDRNLPPRRHGPRHRADAAIGPAAAKHRCTGTAGRPPCEHRCAGWLSGEPARFRSPAAFRSIRPKRWRSGFRDAPTLPSPTPCSRSPGSA